MEILMICPMNFTPSWRVPSKRTPARRSIVAGLGAEIYSSHVDLDAVGSHSATTKRKEIYRPKGNL